MIITNLSVPHERLNNLSIFVGIIMILHLIHICFIRNTLIYAKDVIILFVYVYVYYVNIAIHNDNIYSK